MHLEVRRRRWRLTLGLMAALLLGISVAATGLGTVPVPVGEVLRAIGDAVVSGVNRQDTNSVIVVMLRLPRIALGSLVGASLALAGATLQGLFRNPMADPYIVGISSGASLGATIAMALALRFSLLGLGAVPVFAFVGALGSLAVVYNIAREGPRLPVVPLLLSGVAVGAFLQAIVSFIMLMSDEKLRSIFLWLMGGLAGSTWTDVRAVLPYFLLGSGVLLWQANNLNVILLGDEQALYLGVEVDQVKRWALAAASLITAAAVSVSGLIGFVGLVVPHMVRLIVGPDHRVLLPASALGGAIILVLADTVARTALAPTEIPVGIITAITGGPFFIYLLRRYRRARSI